VREDLDGDARSQLVTLTRREIARQTETAVGGVLHCIEPIRPYFAAQGFKA